VELFCESISLFEVAFVLEVKYFKLNKGLVAQIISPLLQLPVINFVDRNIFDIALVIYSIPTRYFPVSQIKGKSLLVLRF
jgi:hypothetical protein